MIIQKDTVKFSLNNNTKKNTQSELKSQFHLS